MWEACSVECPAMIGGTCGKDTRHSTGKPCSGWSAKYNNAASEVIYSWTMDSGQSDECGTTEYGGSWFALFRNPGRQYA